MTICAWTGLAALSASAEPPARNAQGNLPRAIAEHFDRILVFNVQAPRGAAVEQPTPFSPGQGPGKVSEFAL